VRRYGAPQVSAVAMLATVAMLAGPALANDVTGEVRTMDDGVAGAVVALGIGSGIGYLLWLWALKSIDASTVTAFLMLSPVTALIAGAIFLDEAITITAAVGMALLGAGLWASTRACPKA
jgi:drug/metabolite transporter (DMT)-like permease